MALTAQAAEQQGVKRTVVMIIVILMHIVGLWALQNGLARRLVEILPNDIQTKILKEEKKEEPPPPPPPPPDQQVPPPPFVPPVEVAIAVPVEAPVNAITVTNEKPPVSAPIMARSDVEVKPQFKSRPADLEDYYPSAAKRDGQQGPVVIEVSVGADGRITDAKVVTSSGFPLLDEAAVKYAKAWPRMQPGTKNGAPIAMSFNIKVTFKLKER